MRTQATGVGGGLPYAGIPSMAIALAGAIVLCWPMLFTTAPLGYFDTEGYYSDGQAFVELVQRMLAPATGGNDHSALGAAPGPDAKTPARNTVLSIRSAPYSLFLYLLSGTPLGLVLPVILQTAATLYLMLAFVPQSLSFAPIPTVLGFLGLGLFTTLPWFAAYAMPDILVSAMVIYFIILLGSIDAARGWQAWFIGAVGAFAVASHYANPPLALALCCGVLGWRILTRTLTMQIVVMCLIPVLIPVALNLTANVATESGPSIAPKRLPLLLARSLEDGPAQWYLSEACLSESYAICEIFDEIPDNIGAFLWSPDGIKSATDAQFERIRAEETDILIETMKAYPVAQTRALLGNAALQLVSVGTDQILPRLPDGEGVFPTSSLQGTSDGAIGIFDKMVKLGTILGAGALLFLVVKQRLPSHIAQALVLLLFATLVNGALFGGLSAPVDRYQSRIVWLFPALAVLAWIELTAPNNTLTNRRS